jgi:hypothetical protein
MAAAGAFFEDPVTGMAGFADAQAETSKAKMVRLKSKNLVFIRSSDQIGGHVSARLNIRCWGYNNRASHAATWAKDVKCRHTWSMLFGPNYRPTLVEPHPT